MTDILVVAEHRQGKMRDVTFEALHKARALTRESGGSVVAALFAKKSSDLARKLTPYADRVLLVEGEEFENYNAEPYLAALKELISERKPRVVLIAHSACGMDFAPALAVRLNVPLVTDCVDVQMDGDRLQAQRTCYGGKIEALVTVKPAPCILRPCGPVPFLPRPWKLSRVKS